MDIQLILLYPGISPHQAHTLNQFPETAFLLSTTTTAKRFVWVYEIQVTCEISMSQKGQVQNSDEKESSKELKDM